MKTRILSMVSGLALLLGMSACQDPHEFSPTHHDENLLSMTATFYNDSRLENSFPAVIDHENGIINIVFPYTYPALSESFLTDEDIKHVRVQCNLVLGASIQPALTWLDLTKEHHVVVTGLDGTKKNYVIKGEIRKSSDCILSDFSLPDAELSGVINQETGVITIVTADDLGTQRAEIIMSHGATISPDPRTEMLNYDGDVKLTVTAQNGVDKKEYSVVKGNPSPIPAGGNFDRAQLRWVKKLSDYGIPNATSGADAASGIAIVGNYLVINQAGQSNAVYVNYKTGIQEGTVNLGAAENYRMTSDNYDNILMCNNSKDNGGVLNIWLKKGLNGTPEKIISWKYSGNQMGNQISVTGNLNADAIITATGNGSSIDFARWIVKGGKVVSQEPELVHITGYEGTCWGNADVCHIEATNPASDYICGAYCKFDGIETTSRGLALVDGGNNTIKSHGSLVVSSNWVINAVDAIEFNKVKYAVHNSINTFTWGSDDNLYLYDLSAGDLGTSALDFSSTGLNIKGQYGAMAGGATGIAANADDVKLYVSPNGFYMYIFFEFTNGFVGCVQVDCLDM